jgi:hypothetical protein
MKHDGRFTPLYNSDKEAYDKLKNNVQYMAKIKQPRNIKHHKLAFALAKCVIVNLPEDSIWSGKEPYALIKAIELQLGYVEPMVKLSGEVLLIPESISFESWGQDKFAEFYSKAVPILAAMINVTVEELEEGSAEFM